MKKTGILLFVFLWILISCARSIPDEHSIQDTLNSIIKQQQTAWNNHDIEGFMAHYWQSEDMTFQSGDQRLYGWETLLNRYKTNYTGEKMGTLTFSDIKIKVLSADSAYAIGRWMVKQEDTASNGVFTIIFKRFPSGWKIIHDHSS
ncbi:MAG TPA: nuclear transport factor 2 family protein [Candidatus Aminicenantes bacterium]|nr:nuclear transport factor 2 family protein [Candidatus Aminicenantes bacterium]